MTDSEITTKQDFIEGDWIYDLETYPNTFTFCIVRADGQHMRVFEVSDRKNDTEQILTCLRWMKKNKQRMVGFNNVGFDYPIIHSIIDDARYHKEIGEVFEISYGKCYKKAQDIIALMREGGFGGNVRQSDEVITQVDLFKIHHFDNKARATSLKMLEFNMKSDNIEDLPFPVGKMLNDSEKDTLITYNKHDVMMTLDFYRESLEAIRFRADLGKKFNMNFTNHNDTKIGKDYFIQRLEQAAPQSCYRLINGRKVMQQTKREYIDIKECLFKYYDFKQPAFIAVLEWFRKQRITETKGVFSNIPEHRLGDVAKYAELSVKRNKSKTKPTDAEVERFLAEYPLGWVEEVPLKAMVDKLDDKGNPIFEEVVNAKGTVRLRKVKTNKISYWMCYNVAETLNVVIDGFRFDFGTGGIHGSLSNAIIRQSDKRMIVDVDVASMYPNIAIANKVFPKHLGMKFCEIYKDVYNQRKMYPKGSAENAVMKLALNGVYGDSNSEYSPFYDPQYTMSITVNGQLSLCLLAEKLLEVSSLSLIQCNTDGVTFTVDRTDETLTEKICKDWEVQVGLQLEKVVYKAMYIRDVNNYISEYMNGDVKRKGAYEYEGLGWHQNQSALVIPKAAEAEMLHGVSVEDFINNHTDVYDFMLRTKVPRSSRLVLVMDDGYEIPQQNICRYYPSENGGKLIKIMPPLEEGGDERRLGIDVEWNVRTCNDIKKFDMKHLNKEYFINQAKKLVL